MFMQIIQFESNKPEAELLTTAQERLPSFQKLPGLVQKYYVKLDGEKGYAGVYIWDSKESMLAFRQTELAATIPQVYGVKAPPNVTSGDVFMALRDR